MSVGRGAGTPSLAGRGFVERRSTAARIAIAAAALGLCAGFLALGTWQMHRREWKLALIARVEQRVHAAPTTPAPPADWPQVSAERDEYRRLRVIGSWLLDRETRVHAATALGTGYWLMTPLKSTDGSIVLVNRGFSPASVPSPVPLSLGERGRETVTVTGLLRISEPGGSFLRRNDPAAGRWYSRDVAAIAASRGLTDVAPYFIDAEAPPAGQAPGSSSGDEPVAGLTIIQFPNNHLVYAVTWYALALMAAAAAWRVAFFDR